MSYVAPLIGIPLRDEPRIARSETGYPLIAVCARCERQTLLVRVEDQVSLPANWTEVIDPTVPSGRSALCPDCAPKRLTVAQASGMPLPLGPAGASERVPTGKMYGGCRVLHWQVGNRVVLRIHGGEQARPGERDEPVHFLADAEALGVLRDHFAALQRECLAAAAGKDRQS